MVSEEEKKRKPMNVQMFLAFVIFGCTFASINLRWFFDRTYYPFTMIMFCILIPLGISMYFFRGVEAGPGIPERERGKYYLRKAPLRSKLMWWLSGLCGAGIGFWLFLMDAVNAK